MTRESTVLPADGATSQPVPALSFDRSPNCPLDPPAQYAELRGTCPVARVEIWDGTRPWLLTRHADITAILRNPALTSDISRPNYPQPSERIASARASQKTFVRMDPPEHGRKRRMVVADFAPGEVAKLKEYMEGLVDQLMDELAAKGSPADLLADFAQVLPAHVICKLLDLPDERFSFFLECVDTWMSEDVSAEASRAAYAAAVDYFTHVVRERNVAPGDDTISRIIKEHVHAGELTEEELVHMCVLLLTAGFDTTANMIATGTFVLLQNPDQLADLRAHPDIVPNAVEELNRFITVAHHTTFRLATQDIDVGGIRIRAGEGIVAPVAAANRHPEVFENPDQLDLRRDARRHIAFGYGPHQCAGQHLARVEMVAVFTKLFLRFPNLRLAVDPSEIQYRNSMIYGVKRLPVLW